MKINKKNILAICLAFVVYMLSYQIPKYTVSIERVHFLVTFIDDYIPFYSPSILLYYLAFFQWIYTAYILSKQETSLCYKYSTVIIVGSIIGFICFIVYPTGTLRPEIVGNGFFEQWIKYTYSVDNIIDACPSYHCFVSSVVLYILKDSNVNKKILYLNFVISFLVYLSTLLTKQHLFVDVPCGILLAILSVKISNKVSFTRIFDKLNNLFLNI